MRVARLPFLLALLMACSAEPVDSNAEDGSDQGELGATGTAGAATELPNSIHWVRNSAEYQAAVRQAYRLATLQVDAALAREPMARGTWGVVLDADETIVDNSEYNRDRAFSPEGSTSSSWDTWVNSKSGRVIAPALPFLKKVQSAGGRVFIVTNRAATHCQATEENLRAISVPFDALLCKGALDRDKNGRFEAIERGVAPSPHPATKIVVFVGDNILDFPKLDQSSRTKESELAEFGSRFVLIPNPMYGSWEKTARR